MSVPHWGANRVGIATAGWPLRGGRGIKQENTTKKNLALYYSINELIQDFIFRNVGVKKVKKVAYLLVPRIFSGNNIFGLRSPECVNKNILMGLSLEIFKLKLLYSNSFSWSYQRYGMYII